MISAARLPIQNGVGTVGYTVYGDDLSEAAARSTAGVVRLFEGDEWAEYAVVITLPDGVTEGVVVWDDGSGHAMRDVFKAASTRNITIEVAR